MRRESPARFPLDRLVAGSLAMRSTRLRAHCAPWSRRDRSAGSLSSSLGCVALRRESASQMEHAASQDLTINYGQYAVNQKYLKVVGVLRADAEPGGCVFHDMVGFIRPFAPRTSRTAGSRTSSGCHRGPPVSRSLSTAHPR